MRPHFILFATATTLLFSCSSQPQADSTPPTELQQQLAKAQQQALALRGEPQTVAYEDEFWVPSLSSDELSQPAWFHRPVTVAVTEIGFTALVHETFAAHEIRVDFIDRPELERPISLQYHGSLGGLLAELKRQTGFHLEFGRDFISWSKYQLRSFDVAFLNGSTQYFLGNKNQQQQTQGNTERSAFTQTSDQFLNFSNDELSVWRDLEAGLKLLLSAHGTVQLNQSSTSVLVRDTPQRIERVARYLTEQNERLLRQVAIDVQIIEVTFHQNEQFSIDWQALLETASGSGQLALSSASFTSGGVLGSQLSWTQQSGRAAGSQVFFEALQEQGRVNSRKQPRLLSLNNQIAKLVLEDNATYLAAAGSVATANVGTSTTLEPGVVTTGFELYLLPSIQQGQVILQLSSEISDLQAIDEVRSGEQLIQTPHTQRKKFFMKARVGDGETLLLSGLQQHRETTQEQQSWLSLLLGGRNQQSQQQTETLLLITPRIIEG